jgi:hypothetical protein
MGGDQVGDEKTAFCSSRNLTAVSAPLRMIKKKKKKKEGSTALFQFKIISWLMVFESPQR